MDQKVLKTKELCKAQNISVYYISNENPKVLNRPFKTWLKGLFAVSLSFSIDLTWNPYHIFKNPPLQPLYLPNKKAEFYIMLASGSDLMGERDLRN